MTPFIQTVLWYFNTAFNLLEFFIIIWVIRDRKILVTSLKHLSETVYELAQNPHITPKLPKPPKNSDKNPPKGNK